MSTIPVDKNLLSPMGDLQVAVAIGAIANWRNIRKFGMNGAVPSGTEEMWPLGTLKVWPTVAGVVSVTSDDVGDDVGGIGALTVTIQGLDENYLEIEETVTMTGATPAVTTQEFYRVNRAFNVTAGTNQINVGNITGSIDGDPQFYIEAGQGQTHQTHYTVPADNTLIVTYYNIGVGRMAGVSDCSILFQQRGPEADAAWRSLSEIYLFNGGSTHNNTKSVTLLPEKTDLKQIIKSSVTTQAHSVWSGYLTTEHVG